MQLLVGLGNPGNQYKAHRHNAGFMVLDRLQGRVGASEWREKFTALVGRGVVHGVECTLAKPQTFMNLSGRTVQKAATQLGVKPADIVVVHDDLELPFGTVRVKLGGGHGGHNGLRDINATIGPDYVRVRVGIGRPPGAMSVENYVLSSFSKEEAPELERVLETAVDAVSDIVALGVDKALAKHGGPGAAGAKGGGRKK